MTADTQNLDRRGEPVTHLLRQADGRYLLEVPELAVRALELQVDQAICWSLDGEGRLVLSPMQREEGHCEDTESFPPEALWEPVKRRGW